MTDRPKNTMRRDLMLMIGLPFVLVVGLFFSCLGSGKFAGASDLIALSQGLMTEFHLPGASVGMSGEGQMTVTLSGVTFAGLDSTEGAAKAKAIALYARAHWQGTEPITSVAIKLSTTSGVPGFTMTRTEIPYTFTVAELTAIPPDSVAPSIPDSTAVTP